MKRIYQKGFTLIELLIVIAILGILATVIMVAINPAQRLAAARNSRVRADLANVASQANIFNADTGINCAQGSYPADFSDAGLTCIPATPFMAVVNDPQGNPYDIESLTAGGAACDAGTAGSACTRLVIEGPSYADGINNAGLWCWRSATGTVAYAVDDATCAP